MTDQTVPELTGYQATAAELRRIADAIEHLELDRKVPFVTLGIQPSASGASPGRRIADVDAVALAVLGCAGQRDEHDDGAVYHVARVTRAGMHIAIHAQISKPTADEPEAER